MKTALLCTAFLIVGLLIGIFIPFDPAPRPSEEGIIHYDSGVSRPSLVEETQTNAEPASGSTSEPALLRPVATTLSTEFSQDTVVVPTDLLAQLSHAGSSRNLGQAILDPEGVLEQALQLSEQEQNQILTSWEATKQRIRELEVEASSVQEMEDLSVRITLPSLTSKMDGIGQQFNQSIQKALGQNRGNVFLAAKQVDKVLAKSSAERSYSIVAESLSEGEWRFNMTLESPAGRRVWVGNSIPEELRHLTDAAGVFPTISELPDTDD